MSNIETTVAELHGIATGVDRAANEASAAAAKAGEIAARAAASGFAGIAGGMHRVQAVVLEAAGLLRTATDDCWRAVRPVAEAPKERSPEETITLLSAAGAKAEAVYRCLIGTIEKIDEALRMAAAILLGGQPGPLLGMLGELKQFLVALIQHVRQARQHLVEAVVEAERTGQVGEPA